MSDTTEAVRPARADKSNTKAAVKLATDLQTTLAAGTLSPDLKGEALARSFLKGLRKDPGSVLLIGYVQDASRPDSSDELFAFCEILQAELVRALSPNESVHSVRTNPLIDDVSHAETATNIADATMFLSLAEAEVRGNSDLGDGMVNGLCRLKDCITQAARALADDLQKAE